MRSGGRRVGPQVDDDGPGGVEPLQRALRAAEVDLLHVSAVRLVAQAAAGRGRGLKTIAWVKNKTLVRFRRAYGRDLLILRLSGSPTRCSCRPTNLSPGTDVVAFVSDVQR